METFMRWILVVIGCLITAQVGAESGVLKLTCEFPTRSSSTNHAVSQDFKFELLIDRLNNTAYIVGNNGVEPLELFIGAKAITTLERLPTGSIQTTTIALDGFAVHSRHTMMTGGMVPSQNYGSCKPR